MYQILVVDDEPLRHEDIEEEVKFSLGEFEVRVQKAADIDTAERLFRQSLDDHSPFSAVVLDLHLPASQKTDEEGGWYLLNEFASQSPCTTYILSSGTPPEGKKLPHHLDECLQDRFFCIPKTAPRWQLIEALKSSFRSSDCTGRQRVATAAR
jgi:hypothetical protein